MPIDLDKPRLTHKLNGSRKLDDKVAEAVAYLMAGDNPFERIYKLTGINADQLEEICSDEFFQFRLKYLQSHKKKKIERPRSLSAYKKFALRNLHGLAKRAEKDDDRIKASIAIVTVVTAIQKDKAAAPQQPAIPTASTLSKAFEGEQ